MVEACVVMATVHPSPTLTVQEILSPCKTTPITPGFPSRPRVKRRTKGGGGGRRRLTETMPPP